MANDDIYFYFQASDQNGFNMNDMEEQLKQLEGEYTSSEEGSEDTGDGIDDEDDGVDGG